MPTTDERGGAPFNRPQVSVVIPSFQRRESLLEAVEAVCRQDYPHDRYEIIVVLDGSQDGSREALEQRAWPVPLKVLWQENQGAGRARNRGTLVARGEVVAFLDDDVVPRSGWLEAHGRTHHERPAAAVVLGYMAFSASAPGSCLLYTSPSPRD